MNTNTTNTNNEDNIDDGAIRSVIDDLIRNTEDLVFEESKVSSIND